MRAEEKNQKLQPFISLVEDIGDAVCILSLEGKLAFINTACQHLLKGSSQEQILSYGGLTGLLPANVYNSIFSHISANKPWTGDVWLRTVSGESIPAQAKAKPLTGADGTILGAMLYFKSTSGKDNPEECLRLMEPFVKHAHDAIMITKAHPIDEPGPQIVYTNPAFTQITGYTQEEVLGKSPRFLQGPATSRTALDQIRKALETNTPITVELINYTKSGQPFWVEFSIVPVPDENSTVTHYVSIQREITHKRQAEEMLSEKNEALQKALQINKGIFEHSLDVICVFDKEVHFVQVSQACQRLWGYNPEELIGQSLGKLVYPGDMEKTIAMSEKFMAEGIMTDFEHRIVHKDGRLIPMLWTGSWSEESSCMFTIGRDISEKKAAEERIKQSEQLYRSLSQNYPNGTISICDKEFNVLLMEGQELTRYNVTSDMLTGRQLNEIFGLHVGEYIKEKIAPTFEGESLFLELHFDTRYYLCTTVPLIKNESIDHILVVTQDITSRKQIEQKLQENEQRYKSLFEYHPDAVCAMDLTGNFISLNPAMATLAGAPIEELLNKSFVPLVAPQDRDQAVHYFKKACEGHPQDLEINFIMPTGDLLMAHLINIPIIINKEITGVYCILKDITPTKKAQKLVEQTAERLNNILNSIGDGFFTLDKHFTVTYWNKTAEKITNINREKITGKTFWEVFPATRNLKYYEEYNRALDEQVPVHFEECYTPANVWTEVNVYPSEEGLTVYFRDITERKKAEENLQNYNLQLQKINHELDQFVYRASHDLRAPLVSIMGLINLSHLEKDEEQKRQYLVLMEKSVRKLDTFIQDIIYYSKNSRTELVVSEADFAAMISSTVDDLKFMEEAKSIDFRTDIKQPSKFYTDENRLTVVLHNIIANAIRYHDPSKEQFIAITARPEGKQRIRIIIADNGQGIAKEHQAKVFEMFYRATDKNVGSGLGLYIVKENLKKLKGTIALASEPGKGTTFTIEIPNLGDQQPIST
ncbi:PAS domain S-box protein [Rhodocytophaga aerolata]|uniref:histidine kinase n=1 Tax=Rhodocytophaga aerolata TaxID=455078 RepID=A0ABT8R5J1_9BACT|nr:PAS domain S-box protein [Rhodocytophaga aerolata]MDO1447366.1 PAS domain S-box protein [Rhodocytophaga aerolata]